MKIALVGGIYGKDAQYRAVARFTPETVLEGGLRARGCRVETYSHYSKLVGRDFDVIHVHHLSYGALRASADPGGAGFVYTSHDPEAVASLSQSFARRTAASLVMSRSDAVVALSEREAHFQRRAYPLAGAIHRVIPNGIDFTNYYYSRHNTAGIGRPWHLLFVGQLIAQKNVGVLLRALGLVEKPVDFALAYHNPAMEADLRRLACDLGLKERVQFLGPKTPLELAGLYRSADLFVLPSAGEALPSVVTEAMACGTPVVATEVGGIPEQLGGYGVIVRPGSVKELAAGINQALENYEAFASRGEEMSQYARERFSIDAMVDRHLELYSQLIAQKGRRRRHSGFKLPLNAAVRMGVAFACARR